MIGFAEYPCPSGERKWLGLKFYLFKFPLPLWEKVRVRGIGR